jgi:hypothetical protein
MATVVRICDVSPSLSPRIADPKAALPSLGVLADGYWVACQRQVLRWTSTPEDPSIFSVALLNSDQSFLNGNYQIANSLNTSLGEADMFVNCLAPGTYSVLLVNASQYSLDRPQVFATSSPFQLMPNGTDLSNGAAVASSSSSADPTSSSTVGPSSSATSSHSSSSAGRSSSAITSPTISPSGSSGAAAPGTNGARADGHGDTIIMLLGITGSTLFSAAIALVTL